MPSKYKINDLPLERTFIMVKPDGVMRGLIGEIVKRIEQRGLKIVAMKMVEPGFKHVNDFYPKEEAWIIRLGNKGLKTFQDLNLDPKAYLGTDDAKTIGTDVRKNLIEYMTMGPVVPMIVEGLHAISVVRKLVGHTFGDIADPGTIRGDFSIDSPTSSNIENRSIINLVHASETAEEAKHEIAHWFAETELYDYDRSDHVIMFGDKRNQK